MSKGGGGLKELIRVFELIPDFRIERHKKYKLTEILFLVLSASIGGMRSWDEMADFGEDNIEWLQKFFPYSQGIPSHDTLNRVLGMLNYRAFEDGFISWAKAGFTIPSGAIINIDGKKLRSSASKQEQQLPHVKGGKSAVYLVEAWCNEVQLCLGQSRVDSKSNEIVAIPELLDWLEIEGSVITIDAIGCQKEIAQQIVEQKADYVLGLKGNQPRLHTEVKRLFESATVMDAVDPESGGLKSEWEYQSHGHGRVEKRICRILPATVLEEVFIEAWKGLHSIVEITSYRHVQANGQFSVERRYYISSMAPDAKRLNDVIRSHWSIENQLHWALDVQFGEDQSRKQQHDAAANYGLILRWVLSLLKQNKDKLSIKRKMNKCLWNHTFREQMLGI